MKKAFIKTTSIMIIALLAALMLTSCGVKKSPTVSKTTKTKNAEPLKKKETSSKPADKQTEQEQFTSELSHTNEEMSAAVNEIDSVLKEIDQIDINEDNVPKL